MTFGPPPATSPAEMEQPGGRVSGGVFEVAGFTFTSNFDSGNLAHVQQTTVTTSDSDTEVPAAQAAASCRPATSTSTAQPRSAGADTPDYEFELWTAPDCSGTEFENGNRTWFFFGLKGGPVGAVLKFTVMNMNKQSKLFSSTSFASEGISKPNFRSVYSKRSVKRRSRRIN